MNAKDLIQVMKGELKLAHQKKIQQLNIEQLNNWIDDLDNLREESIDEELTEELKTIQLQKWEGKLEKYKADTQSHLEGFRSTIQFALAALKCSILINGGAAVALLAFIGHIWGTEEALTVQSQISTSLNYFLWGIFVSAVATGSSYLAQAYYSDLKRKKIGDSWRFVSCVLIIFSYIFFLVGGYSAQEIFSTPPKETTQTKQIKHNTNGTQGQKIFSKANEGSTALYIASQRGHEAIVELLLEKGVNANIQASDGSTALIQASQNGHKAIVNALLGKGADVKLRRNDGATALSIAKTKSIIQLLKAAGAK